MFHRIVRDKQTRKTKTELGEENGCLYFVRDIKYTKLSLPPLTQDTEELSPPQERYLHSAFPGGQEGAVGIADSFDRHDRGSWMSQK